MIIKSTVYWNLQNSGVILATWFKLHVSSILLINVCVENKHLRDLQFLKIKCISSYVIIYFS